MSQVTHIKNIILLLSFFSWDTKVLKGFFQFIIPRIGCLFRVPNFLRGLILHRRLEQEALSILQATHSNGKTTITYR